MKISPEVLLEDGIKGIAYFLLISFAVIIGVIGGLFAGAIAEAIDQIWMRWRRN